MIWLTTFGVAAVVTAVSLPLVLPWLRRANVLDEPNDRSSHTSVVPRGGGLAALLGVCVAALVSGGVRSSGVSTVLVTAMALGAVGFLDDVRGLAGGPRLLAQLAGATLVVGMVLSPTTAQFSPSWVASGLAVVAFAAYVNAFNFMDGVNGISGASAAVAGTWYWWLGATHDLPEVATLGAAVAGAAVGFVPWNAPQARVFLGDIGSYLFGALIAGLALLSWGSGQHLVVVCAPLVIYVTDTGWTLMRRLLRGERITQAHREHVYQRLLDVGVGHSGAASIAAVAAVACCLLVLVFREDAALQATALVLLASVYLALPCLLAPLRSHVGDAA